MRVIDHRFGLLLDGSLTTKHCKCVTRDGSSVGSSVEDLDTKRCRDAFTGSNSASFMSNCQSFHDCKIRRNVNH